MKGYMGFEADFTCEGHQYRVGEEYKMSEPVELCSSGYHFCRSMRDVFSYCSGADKRYAEIEAVGDVIEDDDKCVTDHIRIIREIPRQEYLEMVNTGSCNTGICNTGDFNAGDCNAGSWNAGSCNTGNWNTGNRNTGIWNTGICNTGSHNAGICNTGDFNTGDFNTGNWNAGRWNAGGCNAGSWNTGDYNVSNGNSGCFNTEETKIMMFNRPSGWTFNDWLESKARAILSNMPTTYTDTEWVRSERMTDEEKAAHPDHAIRDGYLRAFIYEADRQGWWDRLDDADKMTVMELPNFDADVFFKCTGIRCRQNSANGLRSRQDC